MKKGEVYEGIIEKVEFPNKGYVMVEDERVLVKNGIPGQRIRFMIQKKRKNKAREELWRFWKSLPWKKESRCAAFFLPAAAVCTRQCLTKSSLE